MARLYLVGRLRLEGPTSHFDDDDLPGTHPRLVLVALGIRHRALSADELGDMIWGSDLPPQWRTALSSVASKLRSSIGSVGLDGRQVLRSGPAGYALTLPAGSWVDLEDARRRLDAAEGALRHGEARSAARNATVASAVLRRRLLPGIDNAWVDVERRRIQAEHHRCLVVLSDAWNRLGDHGQAAVTATAAIELDPLREIGHRLLIQAELGRDDHSAALRAFDSCVDTLRRELDASPAPATAALVDGLR